VFKKKKEKGTYAEIKGGSRGGGRLVMRYRKKRARRGKKSLSRVEFRNGRRGGQVVVARKGRWP